MQLANPHIPKQLRGILQISKVFSLVRLSVLIIHLYIDLNFINSAAKYDKKESKQYQKQIDMKNKELKRLLAKPLFPKGFSCKYPLSSGQVDIPLVQGNQHIEKAVDVMKDSLKKTNNSIRKKPKALFKSKINKINNSKIILEKRKRN